MKYILGIIFCTHDVVLVAFATPKVLPLSQKSIFMSFLIWYFMLVNLVAFSIIGLDKKFAVQQKWRISERLLLLASIIGGTIGSGLAMLFFRHKTSKISFLWKFFLIAIIQVFVFYFYVIKSK